MKDVQSFKTGEELNLGNLPEYWAVLDAEFAECQALPPLAENRLLSARAFDEAQPAGHRTYMAVSRYLTVARDNHDALLALLRHHGATVWAPWSLLRPIFESSFFAAWILDPSEGVERRFRGLRSEVLDAYEQRRHVAVFKSLPELAELIEQDEAKKDAGSFATYRAEADALGRTFAEVSTKVNVVDALRHLTFVNAQPETGVWLEATWRQLSGFEHGLGWAMLRGSDRQVVAEVPGGSQIRVVVNDENFVNAAKMAYFLLLTACRLLRRRHLQKG